MKNRVRLGAAAAVALGALLLATVLASPALAWRSNVSAEAECLDDGQIQVNYTVSSWEEGHTAYVKVFYTLNGEKTDLEPGKFDKEHSEFSDSFVLPAGTTGTVTVYAVAFWKDSDEKPTKNESKPVELPEDCKGHESSTSSSESTTSTSESTTTTTMPSTTESSVAPTTSIEETTTTAAVGAATSTTAGGGQLPFTGANSGPMLLAGIALVAGGSLFLLLSRSRDGHATK